MIIPLGVIKPMLIVFFIFFQYFVNTFFFYFGDNPFQGSCRNIFSLGNSLSVTFFFGAMSSIVGSSVRYSCLHSHSNPVHDGLHRRFNPGSTLRYHSCYAEVRDFGV